MIDFVKLKISDFEINYSLVDSSAIIRKLKGDVVVFTSFESKCMTFNETEKKKELRGSLHYAYNKIKNNESHNANDFDYRALCFVVDYLKEQFKINPDEAVIENLEYGVNINVPFSPERFIDNCVLVFRGETPNRNHRFNGNGKYIQFEKGEYYLKLYDKGKQFALNENIMRFEKKVIKSRQLRNKKFNIRTLSDLLSRGNLQALKVDLLSYWDEIIIVDTITPQCEFSDSERKIFEQGVNPKNWVSLNRGQRYRLKKSFLDVLDKHGLQSKKKEVRRLISDKWDALMMRDVFTVNKTQNATFSPLYIGGVRTCIVTGLNISHQKKGSKYLSEKTIAMLYRVSPETFFYLKKKYYRNENKRGSEGIFYYIAHNIRNEVCNIVTRIRKNRMKYQNSLFPMYWVNVG